MTIQTWSFMRIPCLSMLLSALFLSTGFTDESSALPLPRPLHPLRPILTTTAIIEVYSGEAFEGIVLIERGKAPFGVALPGGKVEWGETVEDAVRREMREETNLELTELRQFHVYSDPMRDKRHHSIEVTFLAKSASSPVAGDDAKEAYIVPLDQIPWEKLAFDHERILRDYLAFREGDATQAMAIP